MRCASCLSGSASLFAISGRWTLVDGCRALRSDRCRRSISSLFEWAAVLHSHVSGNGRDHRAFDRLTKLFEELPKLKGVKRPPPAYAGFTDISLVHFKALRF